MSIVELSHVTLVGHTLDRPAVIEALQDLGCLHVEAAAETGTPGVSDPPVEAAGPDREALEFLLACPGRRRQVLDDRRFDAAHVEQRALAIAHRLRILGDERDFLRRRIVDVEPWGDFHLPELEDLDGKRMWFYVVPAYEMARFREAEVVWAEVHADNRFHYVVVLGESQPEGLPVPRTHTGTVPLSRLRARLDDVEFEIEDLELERSSLTRWCTLLERDLHRLEDRSARKRVAEATAQEGPLWALRAWAPAAKLPELQDLADRSGLLLDVAPPRPEDRPPTLLENPPGLEAGEGLVTFYRTPGYFSWDPSTSVFLSFTVFFGLIVSDAGYGLLLGLVLARYWRRLGARERTRPWRSLLAGLCASTVVVGLLSGNLFGLAPPPASWRASVHLLDMGDAPAMMAFSVVVGVLHVGWANLVQVRRLAPGAAALAPLGWILVLAGGLSVGAGTLRQSGTLHDAGVWTTAIGGLLVLGFSGAGQGLPGRLGRGVLALTRVTKVFGDVLSYLRLFALGLASASLAAAFNDMSRDVRASVPGVGLLLGLLVLGVGHGLNLVLAVASGVIHGLRLNVIEFLDWAALDEGRRFRPFRRKERTAWNR